MANIKISFLNRSTVLTDDQVAAALPALQQQVHADFYPVWGTDADLSFVASDQTPAPGTWWLTVFDNSDTAGALGYHDLTSEGLPIGKVFAETDLQSGSSWTVTASHELLEMLGDPDINLTVFVQDQNKPAGLLYAYEVCDACEADELGYEIDGTLVSDFVYPAWFESFRAPRSTQFDKQGAVSEPFELLPGGYIGVFDVTAGNGWQQITKRGEPFTYNMRGRLGSRRERRTTLRTHWIASRPLSARMAGRNGGPAAIPQPIVRGSHRR
jgi:hypothetical protein